jgi:probable HAF family extracellular repeat protein
MLCWITILGGALIMMGRHDRSEALFYYFRLEDQVPETHLLRLIDKHISFAFVREKLKASYSDTGRPSIDPELLLRILLIGYLYGITSERKLVEELRMHLAWRWFTGLGFDQEIPHHSTFSKNRHGRFQESKLFEQLFEQIVRGLMTDLGNLGCTSTAYSINSRGQIAGTSRLADCQTVHAVLWQNGKIYDLNDIIPPGSGLELFETHQINDEGVIAGNGLPPGCDDVHVCGHAFLLFPCDEERGECKNESVVHKSNTPMFYSFAVSRPLGSDTSRVNHAGNSLRDAWSFRRRVHARTDEE